MEKETKFISEKYYKRLDNFLAEVLDSSRSSVSKLIKIQSVSINGKIAKKQSLEVNIGDAIEIDYPEAEINEGVDVDFDVEILYEDDELLVVNKPSNLVVHPAPSVKEATLVDWLKKKGIRLSTISGEERHGIVHRIDKDTTGTLVIAKTNEAHEKLSEQLQDKSMGRYYLAIINHQLKENQVVEAPIARCRSDRKKMAVVSGGKMAKSAFSKILTAKNEKQDLIAAKLFTGRTHQIRVHLKTLGRHILGDTTYGPKEGAVDGMLLHAYLLYLKHPKTEKMLLIEAKPPKAFMEYLDKNFQKEECDEELQKDNIISSFNFCS